MLLDLHTDFSGGRSGGLVFPSLEEFSTMRNRFKGLDLIDRVPDELWNEVHDIVQETGIKTIPMEKKCKKAKWLSGEALQIAVKRSEAKAKEKRKDIPI